MSLSLHKPSTLHRLSEIADGVPKQAISRRKMSDDLQQLYASPKHESPPPPDVVSGPRPTSQRWARVVFVLLALSLPVSLMLASGEEMLSSRRLQRILLGLVGLLGIAIITLGKRKRWAFYGSVACLGLIGARSAWSWGVYVNAIFAPSPAPEFAGSTTPYLMFGSLVNLLVPCLWYRFTFGAPSRAYYGLTSLPQPDSDYPAQP